MNKILLELEENEAIFLKELLQKKIINMKETGRVLLQKSNKFLKPIVQIEIIETVKRIDENIVKISTILSKFK